MCNAMGNLKDYQDAIESSDVILGAAIWDWVDQGLYKMGNGERGMGNGLIIAYGGDFGDKPNDGQFVMNGTVLSDRTPEPGYWEVKHVFQPFAFAFSEDGKKLTVKNLNYFRKATGCTLNIVVLGAERPTRASHPLDIAPRGSATFDVKGIKDGSVCVRGEITLDDDDGILKKGHVIANGQFDFKGIYEAANRVEVKAEGKVDETSDAKSIGFKAGGTEVRFDRTSGALVSYRRGGRELLLAPMTVDAFRAPSSTGISATSTARA
jgi:beta-galactosidase